MISSDSQHAYRAARTLLVLLLLSGLLFALWDAINFDSDISRIWGNHTGFVLKTHPVWGVTIYKAERLIGWAALALLTYLTVKPPKYLMALHRMPKHRRFWMLAAVLLAVFLIQILKRTSLTSCPWDYQIFGGIAQDVSHWRFGVRDGGPGHCFPAGHPSTGFAFLAVPAFLSLNSPRLSAWVVLIVLSYGALLGLTQVVRGAHYVSHALWSAWWCGAVACGCVWLALALEKRSLFSR